MSTAIATDAGWIQAEDERVRELWHHPLFVAPCSTARGAASSPVEAFVYLKELRHRLVPQLHPHLVAELAEALVLEDRADIARMAEGNLDDLLHPPRPGRQDRDPVAHQDGLLDAVGDEDHRAVGSSSQIESSCSCRISRVCASTEANGSSISRTSGSIVRARARPTRCCMPPDSWYGYFCSNPPGRPSRCSGASFQPVVLLHPRYLEPVADVVLHCHPGEQPEVLEDEGDARMRLGDDLVADPDLTLGERDEPVDTAQQRRLAATGGSDQAQGLLVAHVEVEPLEGHDLAERLGRVLDRDHHTASVARHVRRHRPHRGGNHNPSNRAAVPPRILSTTAGSSIASLTLPTGSLSPMSKG